MFHHSVDVLVCTRLFAHSGDLETLSEVVLSTCPVDINNIERCLRCLIKRDFEVILAQVLKTMEFVLVII